MEGESSPTAEPPPTPPGRSKRDRTIDALGDPVNRSLLAILHDAPRSVQEILGQTAVPKSTVYNRLHLLRELGLVAIQRTVISADGKRTDLFRSLVEEAQIEMRGASVNLRLKLRNLSEERLRQLFHDMHEVAHK
jgi:DNA-binding transcriptional ArsR family regulator